MVEIWLYYNYMNGMENLDKTFILFVLENKGITAYQLSKLTGISNETFSRMKRFKNSLSWKYIHKIEKNTGLSFKAPEHIMFHTEYMNANPELFDD